MPGEEQNQKTEVALDPKRGLVIKLCEVMASVGYMQKRGSNVSQNYRYLKEADVADAMREEFSKRNVFIFPNLVKNERVKIVRSKTYKDVIEEKVTYATDVEIDWTFVDGDTGQEKTCRIPGCSESPGDKGVYVAMTGSEKYLLMKSFLIPTGDDPEDDKNETDGKGSREAAQQVGAAKVEKLKKGSQEASQAGASLFYALQPSGLYAVTGDVELMRRIYKQFKAQLNEDKEGKFYMLNDEQLNLLQFEAKEGNIPLSQLKGPKA
jgi:hypothetical protein